MGRLIDETDLINLYDEDDELWWGNALGFIRDLPTVEAIPKADYENRLKADMVAMLTDIQLDVEGQKFNVHMDKDVWNDAIRVCSELIQQRINELNGKVRDKE